MNQLAAEPQLFAYLTFGYVPEAHTPDPFAVIGGWDSRFLPTEDEQSSDRMVQRGIETLGETARAVAGDDAAGKTNVVLLSGGFDSRTVLGALLESVDASNIEACTYGYPGNDEFELGAQVAHAAGVRHTPIDLRTVVWSTEELVASARSRSFPPSFVVGARYFNHLIYSRFGRESVYWDGFLGGSISGAVLPAVPPRDWEEAVWDFIAANQIKASAQLAPDTFDVRTLLPRSPFCPAESMEYSDQLNIALRQTCYIANRIPVLYDTRTLFAHPTLARFMLRLPRRLRKDQVLFKQTLSRSYPDLFAFPIAGGRGRADDPMPPRRNSNRLVQRARRLTAALTRRVKSERPNFVVGLEMRRNPSLRAVVTENLCDLAARKLVDWIDVEAIGREHLSGEADHTVALRVLLSLELACKVQDERDRSASAQARPQTGLQ